MLVVTGSHLVMIEHGDLHGSFFRSPLRPAKELVDLQSRLFTVGHRINHQTRPESNIASGENAVRSGHQSVGIDLQCALACGFDPILRLQAGKIGSLLDGENRHVTWNHGLGSRKELWIKTLAFIEYGNALDDFEANKLPILADELLWTQRRTQRHALEQTIVDFFFKRRHLCA